MTGIPLSTIAAKLITLLENAKDLAVTHQQRTIAADAVRACGVYAKNLKIGVPTERFTDLAAAILDKPSAPLLEMFDDTHAMIVKADRAPSEAPAV
jgi:hypothetical protein